MQEGYQRVYAKIDLGAIRENLQNMKANLPEKTGIMAVVKADGYGHGAIPIARKLQPVSYLSGFAVATAKEAFDLREAGIEKPVLVLGYTFKDDYPKLIEEEIRMAVFREDTLQALSKASLALCKEGKRKNAKVHIKVDTGMNRIGIRPNQEGLSFVKKALATEGIEVEGIFTHFSRADERDKSATVRQFQSFCQFCQEIEEKTGFSIPIKHCANSAGIMEMPETGMDMVRAGIILYGILPSCEVKKDIVPLKPALSLCSRIVLVKEIEKGDAVSYGGTFTARERMKIATIPVGYGDGYPRGLSGKGYVLIHGKRAPILGRVCMDQFMADVTDIQEAKEGDVVTLIGRDKEEVISIETLSALSGRFHYELSCCLTGRVPRLYTD